MARATRATPEQQCRIDAERRLLEAVAANDQKALGLVLAGDFPVSDLIRLRVKPTFNDPTDANAFYHSVASFGLSFVLGENVTQLAARNDLVDACVALQAVERNQGSRPCKGRVGVQAELLAAIRSDSGDQVRRILRQSLENRQLLQLVVKSTYNDATDMEAIYHQVASYGLKFELGDTFLGLAKRNGCHEAVRALGHYTVLPADRLAGLRPSAAKGAPPPADAPLDIKVLLCNAMTGEEVCTVSASRLWTMALFARAAAAEAPAPRGCRIFLRGAAALTAGTVLADLQEEGEEESIRLSTLVMSNVEGVYKAEIKGRQEEGRGRRRGSVPPACFCLELEVDGVASLSYHQEPIDEGHCAPSSGGHYVNATGTWTFSVPGMEVVLTHGQEGCFAGCLRRPSGAWKQEQRILLAMVREGHLDIVQSEFLLERGSRPIPCFAGAALLKSEERDAEMDDSIEEQLAAFALNLPAEWG